MPSRDTIIERRNFFSDRVSAQVRLIATGILLTCWGFLTGTIPLSHSKDFKNYLITVAAISLLSLFFDFLQYIFAFINIDRVLTEMQRTNAETGEFKYDWLYKTAKGLFWAKQACLCLVVFLFINFVVVFVW